MPRIDYAGNQKKIVFTDDADASVRELYALHGKNVADSLARLDRLLKRYAERGRLKSPDEFRQETAGFYAVRALPLRAYGWISGNYFIVSHVIWKKTEKLSQSDINRMNSNRNSFVL